MAVIILVYLSFIGLGLSDSLLGTVWPFMAGDMAVDVERSGVLSAIISVGIIISSLQAWRLIERPGFVKDCHVRIWDVGGCAYWLRRSRYVGRGMRGGSSAGAWRQYYSDGLFVGVTCLCVVPQAYEREKELFLK